MPTTDQILAAYQGADFSDQLKRWAILESVGLDPRGEHSDDDNQFGVAFVYCGSHLRAHSTGWCTVGISNKLPLRASTQEQAEAEARSLSLRLYDDAWTCTRCAKELAMNYRDELCGVIKYGYREPHVFARPTTF